MDRSRTEDNRSETISSDTNDNPERFKSKQSFEKSLQNELQIQDGAQNEPSNDPNDPNDTLHISGGSTYEYPCYYCPYGMNYEDDYERHVVKYHSGRPAYPNKAEIAKHGLTPQGKDWEK
jgi:hypothetical protein